MIYIISKDKHKFIELQDEKRTLRSPTPTTRSFKATW